MEKVKKCQHVWQKSNETFHGKPTDLCSLCGSIATADGKMALSRMARGLKPHKLWRREVGMRNGYTITTSPWLITPEQMSNMTDEQIDSAAKLFVDAEAQKLGLIEKIDEK